MPTTKVNAITTPEGTAAPVTHEDVVKIVQQMLLGDIMFFADATERSTTFATSGQTSPRKGSISHLESTKGYDKWDGSAWIGALGAWTSYVPAWTASGGAPVLNNGTLTGRWLRMNQLEIAEIQLVAGSLTTYGAGVWFFSLAHTASASSIIFNAAGTAWGLDSGVKETGGVCKIEPAGATFRISGAPIAAGTGDNWGPTVPINPWGTADTLTARVMYEPA